MSNTTEKYDVIVSFATYRLRLAKGIVNSQQGMELIDEISDKFTIAETTLSDLEKIRNCNRGLNKRFKTMD